MSSIGSFSGLASGIQWQDMIDQIMKLEAARRVTPLTNRVSVQESRIKAWNDFQGLVGKLKSASSALKDGSALNQFTTHATTGVSGRALVSATASSKAAPGNYRVEVLDLARAEKVGGSARTSATDALGLDGEFFVNGRGVQVAAGDSLTAIRDKINAVNTGSNATGVTATIVSTGATSHSLVLSSSQTGSRGIELVDSATSGGVLQGLGVLDGTRTANLGANGQTQSQRFANTSTSLAAMLGVSAPPATTTIEVAGQKITVDLTTDTLMSVMSKIVAAGASASTVEESVGSRKMYRLSVQGAVTADASAVDPDASQRIVDLLGFSRGGRTNEITAGTDARFRLDGFTMTRRSNTVTDAVAGVTLNLLASDAAQRTSSLVNAVPGLSILKDPKSIDAGSYGINFASVIQSTTTATDDSADLAVSSYAGVADGTYEISLATSTSRATSATTPALSVSASPSSVAAGTYEILASIARSASTTGFLNVLAAASGVAAGTYGVDVQVSRSSTASVGTLQATAAGSGIAAGTYGVQATFARTSSSTSGLLSAAAAGAGIAAGSYAAALNVTRTSTASTASLQATAAGSGVAAGTYAVQATFTRSATTSSGSLSVLAAPSSVAAGSYGVNITQAATRSSVTGSIVNSTFTGNTGDSMTIKDNVTGVTKSYALTAGQTLDSVVSGLNSMFSANGMKMTASNSGGTLKLEHTDYGSSGSFTVTNSVNRVTNAWGVGSTAGVTTANGVNVAGTIGGVAATGSGQTLTGSGALAGLQVQYTGTTTGSGTVTVTDTISSATVGGTAATWNAATQTLTRADGLAVKYTGAMTANNLGASSTSTLGNVTITDSFSGGTIGGTAATWDAASQTLTRADGLAVKYTGSTPAGTLGSTSSVGVGTVTITDSITGGTIGGTAATWDAATQTFTRADGLAVSYTGAMQTSALGSTSTGTLGSVTITDTVSGGTIGGTAATWDAAAQTLTGADGLQVKYTGSVPAGSLGSTTNSSAGTVTVTDTITGGTIGGQSATWDAATQTFARADGLAVQFAGATPAGSLGSIASSDLGDVTITDTTEISGGSIKDTATGTTYNATWDASTNRLTGDPSSPVAGLSVAYSGGAASGAVGNVTITTANAATVNQVTIGGVEADWDDATDTIRGRAGSAFEGLELKLTDTPSGFVGDLVVEGDIGVDLFVERDVDAAATRVKEWADAYNAMASFVKSQRDRRGPLATNATLRNAMRSATDVILNGLAGPATFTRTAQVGVELDRYGTLNLDTTRIKELVATSSTDLAAFFSGIGENMRVATTRLDQSNTGVVATQTSSLDRSIDRLNDRIESQERRMETRRAMLVKEFSAMESAMGRIQSQGSWLAGQIAGLQAQRL